VVDVDVGFQKEHLGVGCGYMYVGSCCNIVNLICDVGHPSTEIPPSTSFFYPLPHKPFIKRHLLKANCEWDTRESRAQCQQSLLRPPPSIHFLTSRSLNGIC
jgi:hypothetical protein